MGNSCPLYRDFIIHHHIRTVVQLVQPAVLRAQHIRCQCFALLNHFTDIQLKFRKHCLPVQGTLKLLQKMVDQVCPFFPVGGLAQQVLHQKCLIAGGCHLRHKDHIAGINRVLAMIGIVGVQGMAHFVGKSKLAVQRAGVIQQHIRMHPYTG